MLFALFAILGIMILWLGYNFLFSWLNNNPDFFLIDYISCRRTEVNQLALIYLDVEFPSALREQGFYDANISEFWTLETAFGTYVHRRDGPAVVLRDGTWAWFWMNKHVSLSDYVKLNNRLESEGERLHFFLTWKDKENGVN